jgi:translation initiation factor 3 subunit H
MVLRFFLFTGAGIDGVRIMVDVSQTNRGNASFRAFRLSKEFLDAYRKPPFSAKS